MSLTNRYLCVFSFILVFIMLTGCSSKKEEFKKASIEKCVGEVLQSSLTQNCDKFESMGALVSTVACMCNEIRGNNLIKLCEKVFNKMTEVCGDLKDDPSYTVCVYETTGKWTTKYSDDIYDRCLGNR